MGKKIEKNEKNGRKMEKMQWEVDDDGRLINETFEEDFYLKFHFDVLFPLFLNKTKQGGLGMCQFRRKTFFSLENSGKKATIEAQADHNGDKKLVHVLLFDIFIRHYGRISQ